MQIVARQHGAAVGTIVTCGNLPDLRSITLPLIEEMDMEVETLDSLEGLDVAPPLKVEEIADRAPALRLACAAAADAPEAARPGASRFAAAAAAVLLVGAALWAAAQLRTPRADAPDAQTAESVAQESRPPATATTAVPEAAPPPAAVPQPSQPRPEPEVAGGQPVPVERTPDGRDAGRPAATTGRQTLSEPAAGTAPSRSSEADRAGADERAARPRRAAPLNAPLPTVNSILVSPERRLAVVDGAIVHEGDAVGPRVLVRIEPDAIVLRESSGHEVRVPIRRRFGAKQPEPGI